MTMLQSPLNYTGGKFRLLPQILPLFPQDINTFVDLFCGGANVGINAQCARVRFNDIDSNVIGILRAFKMMPKAEILHIIHETIEQYNLSMSSDKGYVFYNCNSKDGLARYNKNHFLELREHWNNIEERDFKYYVLLYILVMYCFNNQIRFNKEGKFNLPVGKRDFNRRMQQKLEMFVDRIQSIECEFSNADFRLVDIDLLDENDFVYADPPYLIACATYNEQGAWSEEHERALYAYLDELDRRRIRFALSNVLSSKGCTNTILKDWLEANPQYVCHHLNYKYTNSNYHVKDRNAVSDEVLIKNY